MLIQIWEILLALAPWLLLGTAIAGLLHIALPEGLVRRQLRGGWGVIKAVLVGVPMPLCSCGVIPAGLGLKRDGASDGAAIGFLVSTPQTGVDSILVSGSFLGWPFALFKVASAAVTGVVAGWLADRWGERGSTPPEAAGGASGARRRGVRAAWEHSLEILRSIWRWLVVGILVSAAISAFVPQGALTGLSRVGTLGAALVALAVSLPLYVCATASVPIAAALVASGMPTGAALVFLMAGPATNVATIGAIYRGFGRRTLAVYLGTITAGSIGFGVLFDWLLSSAGAAAPAMLHAHGRWWEVAAASLLLALLAWFAWDDLRRWLSDRRQVPASASARHRIEVGGMTCNGCASRLESALRATSGVRAVEVSLEAGQALVQGEVDDARLRQVVREAGFQPL